jgi:hypothetical protein
VPDSKNGSEGPGGAIAAPPGPSQPVATARCKLCLKLFVPKLESGGRPASAEFCMASHRMVHWRLYHPRLYNAAAGAAGVLAWRQGVKPSDPRSPGVNQQRRNAKRLQQAGLRARRKRGFKPYEGTKFERLANGDRPMRLKDPPPLPDDPDPINPDCALCRIQGLPCRMHAR